jgi:hypothetical protein
MCMNFHAVNEKTDFNTEHGEDTVLEAVGNYVHEITPRRSQS